MTTNTVIEECWATHEMLRRLGVQSDDIFIVINTLKTLQKHQILVEARQKKPVEALFQVNVGVVADAAAFQREWTVFANEANNTAHLPENLTRYMGILERSMPWNESLSFMTTFLAKGFDVKNRDGTTKIKGDLPQ